ncbi:GNAT family N-acetyltransferase [Intrasporangium sp.]|uniref:GNAT family N-acetyltransferase n=1 Tax=Intrasporangium sp. TaxID=1925024 RepID=UPI00293ACC15|nr:GNAT family N-acetyltransferase [Intrasporangium sp.]MDV3222687.1 GNAT family N-acetyltransferase [Intrasporangium sp.]
MLIDSPGLATDLAILELEGSTITDHGDHLVVRTVSNPTYYWGNFLLLGTAPAANEIPSWLARFEEEFPAAAHRTFAVLEVEADHSPWTEHGCTVELDSALAATQLIAPEPPSMDAEIRAFSTDDDWEQSARLSAEDDDSSDPEARLTFERRRALAERSQAQSGRGRWFGAFVDGQLVARAGIVLLGARARYRFVVTHPEHRRRGLAGALVHAAGQWALAQPGVEQVVIVADTDGPAINLYRSLGLREAGSHIGIERRPAGVG